MKIAYLILAHKCPLQLARLVDRLDGPLVSFVLHIDRKALRDPQMTAVTQALSARANVHRVESIACAWGTPSLVRATLSGIAAIVEGGIPADVVVLLSGQDYPIKPNGDIQRFFERVRGMSFLEHLQVPDQRLRTPGPEDHGNNYERPTSALPLGKLRLFWGSQWWALSRECIDYVHDFVARTPEYLRYFESIRIPDELFFQTLLVNSPLADRLINSTVKYMLWLKPYPQSPENLTCAHLERLGLSTHLFARKFDLAVDGEILDRIDERLGPIKLA